MLDRFHLTPERVDELDPEFVDELLIFLQADAEHTRKVQRELERK